MKALLLAAMLALVPVAAWARPLPFTKVDAGDEIVTGEGSCGDHGKLLTYGEPRQVYALYTRGDKYALAEWAPGTSPMAEEPPAYVWLGAVENGEMTVVREHAYGAEDENGPCPYFNEATKGI
jgi:hypothetical protein